MIKPLNNITELFKYLIRDYNYELKNVETQNGMQRRLENYELEQKLKNKTIEYIKAKDLFVELKLGPSYNRTKNPWIQIFSKENQSGTKGRYVGISFSIEPSGEEIVKLWIGFGKTGKNQSEVFALEKQYKMRYALIESKLKYGFYYDTNYYSAIIIKKQVDINSFDEKEFARDLEYITNLYKAYEVRFENAMLPMEGSLGVETSNAITYEEINKRMLSLIEEVGNLAKAIQSMEQT